jgi:hypothetical protein
MRALRKSARHVALWLVVGVLQALLLLAWPCRICHQQMHGFPVAAVQVLQGAQPPLLAEGT